MYSRHRWQNFRNKFKRYYLKKGKHSLKILLHFRNLPKIWRIKKKKKISCIPQIFQKLLILRNVVTPMPENSCFRTPFQSQRPHGPQTFLKLALQHFYGNFPLI